MSRAPDFNVARGLTSVVVFDCGTQHGKVQKGVCRFVMFVFCVGIVYLVVVFVLLVFGGFHDVPRGHIA